MAQYRLWPGICGGLGLNSKDAFLVGLAASLGGISMGFTEALSDDGSLPAADTRGRAV